MSPGASALRAVLPFKAQVHTHTHTQTYAHHVLFGCVTTMFGQTDSHSLHCEWIQLSLSGQIIILQ